jgi:hypothetical protein
MKILVATALLTVGTVPALADEGFYIVRRPATQNCEIVQEKPASDAVIIGGRAYTSRSEADSALTTVCTTDDDEEDDD